MKHNKKQSRSELVKFLIYIGVFKKESRARTTLVGLSLSMIAISGFLTINYQTYNQAFDTGLSSRYSNVDQSIFKIPYENKITK